MVKLRIEVGYLEGVENPEASTLFHNLGILGYENVEGLRIYKVYEIEIASDNENAISIARDVASKILINPVINSFTVHVVEEL
ncbi:MAG: phosphoribosylformylglycinamidine synthase subunit PurS [Thermoplasmataceae archaeon]